MTNNKETMDKIDKPAMMRLEIIDNSRERVVQKVKEISVNADCITRDENIKEDDSG